MKFPKLLTTLAVACLAVTTFATASTATAEDMSRDERKVLVLGVPSVANQNLVASLRQLGADVSVDSTYPTNFDGYQEVWTTNTHLGLPKHLEEALIAFTKSGGSLYLSGERSCCEQMNDSIQRIARAVLYNQEIHVGNQGDPEGPFVFNPNAESEISRVPNTLVELDTTTPGGMQGIGGLDSRNVFVANAEMAVGGVWAERDMKTGVGRLVILMDVGSFLDRDSRLPVIENVHSFLSSAPMQPTGSPTTTPVPTATTPTVSATPTASATPSAVPTLTPTATTEPTATSAPSTSSSTEPVTSTTTPAAAGNAPAGEPDALAATGAEDVGMGLMIALTLLATGVTAFALRKRSAKIDS